ncbi:MAG: LemA family protein [Planctomycetes bacterium]|nr:LemA family protein [Planctomycetota bacterium]
MGTTTVIVLSILGFGFVGIIGYFIMIYNGLISVKENIKKSWGNIDVILKQRYDEIPKLISVCESYTQFEKGMLDACSSRWKNMSAPAASKANLKPVTRSAPTSAVFSAKRKIIRRRKPMRTSCKCRTASRI